MSLASMTRNPAWRSAPVACTLRVVTSLARRCVPAFREPVVGFDEGRSRVVADLGTALGLILFRYGIRDPELDLVRRLLRPGDLFVDVGANVGMFSLVGAAKVGPAGRVIALEPAPAMIAMVERNAALSGFSWIEARRVAVGEKPGTAEFVMFGGDRSGLSSFAPADLDGGRTEVVDIESLDDIVPVAERSRLTLVKIDVEGAELGVLRGATEVIETASPDFLIEVDEGHLGRQGASVAELRELLSGYGYRSYRAAWNGAGSVVLREEDDWLSPARTPNLFLTARPERAAGAGILVVGGTSGTVPD